MALVRQSTIAGFRPISKYEYFVPWISKCLYVNLAVAYLNIK